ncbi:MAG: hypothetical protein H6735_32795 [Alphaproteobacteria bacterium]|nr:hypothetical protein [Alphaproteobacteria bacterium]
MAAYVKRIALATGLALGLVPGVASAGPIVSVGISVPLPPPVVVVRPAPPAVGYVWVDGYWSTASYGAPMWIDGYWAPPPPPVVTRTVVVSRPVVTHTRVVHTAPTRVVTHSAPRTVVVHH